MKRSLLLVAALALNATLAVAAFAKGLGSESNIWWPMPDFEDVDPPDDCGS